MTWSLTLNATARLALRRSVAPGISFPPGPPTARSGGSQGRVCAPCRRQRAPRCVCFVHRSSRAFHTRLARHRPHQSRVTAPRFPARLSTNLLSCCMYRRIWKTWLRQHSRPPSHGYAGYAGCTATVSCDQAHEMLVNQPSTTKTLIIHDPRGLRVSILLQVLLGGSVVSPCGLLDC